MSGISGVREAVEPSDGVGCLILGFVYFCGPHNSTPPSNGIFMSKDECMSGSTAKGIIHVVHKCLLIYPK